VFTPISTGANPRSYKKGVVELVPETQNIGLEGSDLIRF